MNDQAEKLRAPRFDDLPARMRGLPVDHRGFPIPWFVAWVDGKPIFPAMDARKRRLAWKEKRCWVCGGKLGRVSVFVVGPMCVVNSTSSEPPSHLECARFSARRCPFLANPSMGRVGLNYKGHELNPDTAGTMLARNPGVTAVYQTLRPSTFPDGRGNYLFDIGKPHAVEWYARGRQATRAECVESIATGTPALREMAAIDPDPEGAEAELERRLVLAFALLPAA